MRVPPRSSLPLDAARPGVCENCCEWVDDYHCRPTRPYHRHTLRFLMRPPNPWWENKFPMAALTEPLGTTLACRDCFLPASQEHINFPPLEHASGAHALNSWLYDNYGVWIPRNYRLEDRCSYCNEVHGHMLQTAFPPERCCVTCYVKRQGFA